MTKLVIRSGGVVQREVALEGGELTIGRGSCCTVCLSDPLVSRNHARLTRFATDYYIEDLGSTNGILLNGQLVTRHILRQGDVLRLGGYELSYVQGKATDEGRDSASQSIVLGAAVSFRRMAPSNNTTGSSACVSRGRTVSGWVRYLQGPNQGETRSLTKSLHTIGKPGEKVAVIVQRAQGLFLLHLGGNAYPMVNGEPVQRGGRELHHGDIIEVGDNRLEMLLREECTVDQR